MTVARATRAKRPKDRADRILAAAAQLFRERGYHAVGIDEIGAAVGISGPAVYRHYDSKAALLVAAAERSIDRYIVGYREGVNAASTAHGKLEAMARANIVGTLDDLDLAAVFIREHRHIPAELQVAVRERQRISYELWISTIRSCRPDLSRRQGAFVASAALGVAWSLVHYHAPLPRRRLEDVLTRVTTSAMLKEPTKATTERASEVFGRILPRTVSRHGTADDGAGAKSMAYRGSRREVVLASAIQLFRQHGFGGVGIDDIGAAAGITGSAVYRHFDSKDDLLASALYRLSEQLAASVGRSLTSVGTPYEALERLIESFLELEVQNADLVFVYLTESQALSSEKRAAVRRAQRAYVDEWVAALREARPMLSDVEARVMVQAAIGILNMYSQLELPRLGLDEIAAILETMALGALLDT